MLLQSFNFKGNILSIQYIETITVTNGVECDVYKFVGDSEKDLGIIRVRSGFSTPLQRILKGDSTIEGYVSGKGKLVITKEDSTKTEYMTPTHSGSLEVEVKIGELMQWHAETDLVFYEICFPPYNDGRFQNL